eukprot:15465185-Alexandrium_andersonii.AAC.1
MCHGTICVQSRSPAQVVGVRAGVHLRSRKVARAHPERYCAGVLPHGSWTIQASRIRSYNSFEAKCQLTFWHKFSQGGKRIESPARARSPRALLPKRVRNPSSHYLSGYYDCGAS